MESHYFTSGFLKNAPYSTYFHGILKEFENSFPGLDFLEVHLDEILPELVEILKEKPISFSPEMRKCVIKLTYFKYQDAKGKPQGKISPQEVFNQLRFVLNRATEEYKKLTDVQL